MKKLVDLILNFIEFTGNPVIDTIIATIIGLFSYKISFKITGLIFSKSNHYVSIIMSCCHWIVRILVLLAIYYICVLIVKLF